MARRIGEAVAVRVAEQAAVGEKAMSVQMPASFIWRDRVYVVREVLGYWRERKAWWNTAAARAVHGDVVEEAAGASAEGRVGEGAVQRSVDGAAPGAGVGDGAGHGLRVAIDHEREVWRVEARGPRTVGTGVYDISREASQVPGEQNSSWRLLAVTD